MRPSPRSVVAVVGFALSILVSTAAASPRTGTVGSDDVLGIASISPWVEPDGEFQVRFAPTSAVPPGAVLTVTIHQQLRAGTIEGLRERVLEVIAGEYDSRVLQAPSSIPLAELGDPTTGATLTIPVRSTRGDRSRILLPNPGIHPVELVLTEPDGPELWSQTVFLNRLPKGEGPEPVQVSLVLPVTSPPSVADDGSSRFSPEDRSQLSAASSLLTSVPDAPLMLAVRPNTLDGLERSKEAWALDLLSRLRHDSGANVIAQQPYVKVDSAALVASDSIGELERQLVIGAGTVATRIQRSPSASTWVGDDMLTSEVLPAVRSSGVRSVLVPIEVLKVPDDLGDGRPISAPVRLTGDEDLRALAYDSAVSRRITDTDVDPAVRAHQAVSLMMSGWFAVASDRTPPALASAVLLPPTTDARVLESLGATLRSNGPLVASPHSAALPESTGDEPTVQMNQRQTPDLGPAVAETNRTRDLISAFRSMADDGEPATELWDELANQSMSVTVDAAQRARMQTSVRRDVDTRIRQIHPPRPRRVVLAGDESVVPLRFRNELSYEVRLLMRARSPRLEVKDPVSEIVLPPGQSVVDLEVEVQAPGESLLRIDLSSPDGGITIPGPAVPVRSTAISGVGAALSILSVLFLFVWWLRTARRRRNQSESHQAEGHLGSASDDRPPAEHDVSDPGETRVSR